MLCHDLYDGLLVWAGMTAHGRTNLTFIDKTLNTQKFRQEILGCDVEPFMQANGGMFQQGKAPQHVARASMDYLR